MVFYKPVMLQEEKQKVINQFTNSRDLKYKSIDKVKELVQRISKWDKQRVEKLAEMLTSQEILLVCGYVITNKYHINCENLYSVVQLRADSMGMESLFRDWQNHYTNKEGQKYVGYFLEFNEVFRKMLNGNKMDPVKIQSWIKSKDIVENLCKKISMSPSLESFKHDVVKLGVMSDTLLLQDCISQFYLYCGRTVYMRIKDSELTQVFGGYQREHEKLFAINLLMKLSLNDLRSFEMLHNSIRKAFPQGRDKAFEKHLKEIGLLQKFEQWTKIMRLQDFFEEDEDTERIDFWIYYVTNNKMEIVLGDRLYIEFGEYVVTEFAGKAAGPAYLWRKAFFNNVVKYRMRDSKNALQNQFMYHECFLKERYKEGLEERMEHKPKGEWQSNFKYQLRRRGIYSVSIS